MDPTMQRGRCYLTNGARDGYSLSARKEGHKRERGKKAKLQGRRMASERRRQARIEQSARA